MAENGDDGDNWTMVPFQELWFSVLETTDGRARSLTHESKTQNQNVPGTVLFLVIEDWICCVSKVTPLSLLRVCSLIWSLTWQSGFSPVLLDTVPYLLG